MIATYIFVVFLFTVSILITFVAIFGGINCFLCQPNLAWFRYNGSFTPTGY